MLDGTRNACCNIKLRCDDLASLPNLQIVRRITSIDSRAGCADGCAKFICDRGQNRVELLLGGQTTTTRDNDAGCCKFRTIGFRQFFSDEARACWSIRCSNSFNARSTIRASGSKVCSPNCDDFFGVAGLHGLDGVACIGWALECIGGNHFGNVGKLHHVKQSGNAWHEVFAVGCSWCNNGVIAVCQSDNLRRHGFRQLMLKSIAFGNKHFGRTAQFGCFLGNCCTAFACDQHMNVSAKLGSSGHGLCGCFIQSRIVVFGNQKGCRNLCLLSLPYSTPASFFSLSTSSATLSTLMPASRAAGSAVLSTS